MPQSELSSGADLGNTASRFKSDIKKLSREDRSFAEGIFRHHCPRDRRYGTINSETCRKAVDECKRKITIPPSAVGHLADIFSDVSGGKDEIDVNGFLAILSRMIHDSDAARRHRNRKVNKAGNLGITDFKRVASNMGRSVGTFLGVVEGDEYDPSLEIYHERQRRLTQRRSIEQRRTKKRTSGNANGPSSLRDNIKNTALGVLKLPGSGIYEADYDEDPEERPLDLDARNSFDEENQSLVSSKPYFERETEFVDTLPVASALVEDEAEGSSLLTFAADGTNSSLKSSKGPPPPLPGDSVSSGDWSPEGAGAPPLPSRDKKDSSAPPLPSRDAGAPALPTRDIRRKSSRGSDNGCQAPALPGRDGRGIGSRRGKSDSIPLLGREDSAPPLPGREFAPPLPGREPAPPLPGRESAPPLPGREPAPPLPGREPAPPLPGRESAPPLPGRDEKAAPALPSRDEKPPALPGRDEKPPALPSREKKGISFGDDSMKQSSESSNAEGKPKDAKNYEFFKHRADALNYYRRRALKEKIGSFRVEKNQKLQTQKEETAMKTARTKSMRHRIEQKFLKRKVQSMPVFSPWMIYAISYAQIIVLVVMVYKGIFDKIGFIPPLLSVNISTLTTASGYEISKVYGAANMWIGPKPLALIQNGATFSPCMRRDNTLNQRYRRANDIDSRSRPGCCVKTIASINTAIYTTERKCKQVYDSSVFFQTTCEKQRHELVLANNHAACCTGIIGQCQMMTLPDCASVEGYYHRNKTCLQVNCIQGLCGFGGLEGTAEVPYTPRSSNQWWRFFTSIFLHHGIIHVVAVAGFQIYIGRRIEASAGWLRIFLIYIVSGMMSNVTAGYVTPYLITTGGGGAVCGLVAVLFVELFNMWSLVKDPVNELINLALLLGLIFVVGTLPHLNNWAHLSGFFFGLLTAIILLPYISFGKWGIRRKRILVAVAFITLFACTVTLLLLFSLIQNTDVCPNCYKFNCINFTPNLCNQFRIQSTTDVAQYSSRENAYYGESL